MDPVLLIRDLTPQCDGIRVGKSDRLGDGVGLARPPNRTQAINPIRTSRTMRVISVNLRTSGPRGDQTAFAELAIVDQHLVQGRLVLHPRAQIQLQGHVPREAVCHQVIQELRQR
jgi:hypothetical protein